jgi:hypothetical protein
MFHVEHPAQDNASSPGLLGSPLELEILLLIGVSLCRHRVPCGISDPYTGVFHVEHFVVSEQQEP